MRKGLKENDQEFNMMLSEPLQPKIHCEKLDVYNTCSSFLTKVDQKHADTKITGSRAKSNF